MESHIKCERWGCCNAATWYLTDENRWREPITYWCDKHKPDKAVRMGESEAARKEE